MEFDFARCRFDDAEIVRVSFDADEVTVTYRDWQESEHDLLFRNVIGVQMFAPEGRALSHGAVDDHDPFIEVARQAAEEDSAVELRVYSFVSVWNDAKILRIVATAAASVR